MNAAPGWYEAETPGRVRWWDGTQWTAHEAPAGPFATPQPAALPPAGPQPGWYPTKPGELRWWDGRIWTGSRVREGRAGIDWATLEQPVFGWVAGGMFLFAGPVLRAVGRSRAKPDRSAPVPARAVGTVVRDGRAEHACPASSDAGRSPGRTRPPAPVARWSTDPAPGGTRSPTPPIGGGRVSGGRRTSPRVSACAPPSTPSSRFGHSVS